MTTESSTTITRNGSCRVEVGVGALANATLIHSPERLKSALLNDNAEGRSAAGSKQADQIRPTSWNLAVTMSLSNGFMMYSLAPACSARAMCATSFSVVQNTTLGCVAAGHAAQIAEELVAVHDRHVPVEQDRIGQAALADFERLLAVLGLDDLEIQAFQDAPCDLSDDAGVIDDKTCSHFSLCFFHPEGTFPFATAC